LYVLNTWLLACGANGRWWMEPLGGETQWKDIRLQGVCPWRGYWDPGLFFNSGHNEVSSSSSHEFPTWCTAWPQAQSKTVKQPWPGTICQNKPFFLMWCLSQAFLSQQHKANVLIYFALQWKRIQNKATKFKERYETFIRKQNGHAILT
jgi:hypothetical protein